jgi:hypothetical protein
MPFVTIIHSWGFPGSGVFNCYLIFALVVLLPSPCLFLPLMTLEGHWQTLCIPVDRFLTNFFFFNCDGFYVLAEVILLSHVSLLSLVPNVRAGLDVIFRLFLVACRCYPFVCDVI